MQILGVCLDLLGKQNSFKGRILSINIYFLIKSSLRVYLHLNHTVILEFI